MGALTTDLMVRSAPKSTIRSGTAQRLPRIVSETLRPELLLRASRLMMMTDAFADLWNAVTGSFPTNDQFSRDVQSAAAESLFVEHLDWTPAVPLRRAADRRQAQLEIDAIVALSLGITSDELCTIYRTQFAVLYGYDRNVYFYDANGRLVPNEVLKVWRQKGDAITLEERQAVHPGSGIAYTYELPFVTLDREADMRQAYAHFERILKERS